jgi:tRNA-specific 2-thiouridylase
MNFVTPFCNCNRSGRCEAQHVGDRFDIPVKVIGLVEGFFQVVRKPRYGYGSGMNPCLDCRILMFSRARASTSGALPINRKSGFSGLT